MNISKLCTELEKLYRLHGDLEIEIAGDITLPIADVDVAEDITYASGKCVIISVETEE